jgi:hypothetical protein
MPAYANEGAYHLGFELRTGETGDGKGPKSQAINEVVTHVLSGPSGLINHLQATVSSRPVKICAGNNYHGPNMCTDLDLGKADLGSGNLSPQTVQIDNPHVIWFTHNRSPALKPDEVRIWSFAVAQPLVLGE